MKKVLKITGIIVLVLAVGFVGLYLYADNKPYIHKGYQESIETGVDIEAKYLHSGDYQTEKITAKAEDPIKKYTIYYPTELEIKVPLATHGR